MTTSATQHDPYEEGIESAWARFRRRFFAQPGAVAAATFIAAILLVALLAPVIATQSPERISLGKPSFPPSLENILGTDDLGRDMFSRLVFATRLSMASAILAVGVAASVGLLFGVLGTLLGRTVDAVVMRFNDIMLVFPTLIFAVVIIGVVGPGLLSATIAIGLAYAPYYARVVRGAVVSVWKEPYVEAAQQLGASDLWVLRKHVLPNILSPLIVQTTLMLGLALLAESGLSFIGLGVEAPDATWGSMLQRSFEFMDRSILNMLLPGGLIMVTVLSFNFLGDGLRDALGREERKE